MVITSFITLFPSIKQFSESHKDTHLLNRNKLERIRLTFRMLDSVLAEFDVKHLEVTVVDGCGDIRVRITCWHTETKNGDANVLYGVAAEAYFVQIKKEEETGDVQISFLFDSPWDLVDENGNIIEETDNTDDEYELDIEDDEEDAIE